MPAGLIPSGTFYPKSTSLMSLKCQERPPGGLTMQQNSLETADLPRLCWLPWGDLIGLPRPPSWWRGANCSPPKTPFLAVASLLICQLYTDNSNDARETVQPEKKKTKIQDKLYNEWRKDLGWRRAQTGIEVSLSNSELHFLSLLLMLPRR